MELETVRAITDWLNHATHGVNAKLATLPLDVGDTVPADILLIVDETRNAVVARDRFPAERPCITVRMHAEWVLEGEVMTVERNTEERGLPVLIRTMVSDALTATGFRDLYYYNRAIRQSLREFLKNDYAQSHRTRNDVAITLCQRILVARPYQDEQDKDLTSAQIVYLDVCDNAP